MGAILVPSDLAPFAKIEEAKAVEMIADAEALALRVAPCLGESPDQSLLDAAKAILRRAILRWHDTGSAGTQSGKQQTAGPFTSNETWQVSGSRGLFFPSEISDLQALCRSRSGKAFVVDQVQPTGYVDPFVARPDLRFQYGWPGVL